MIKNKLRMLLKKNRWKFRLLEAAVNALTAWQQVVDYYFYLNFNFLFARRAFVKRSAQRAHWVGAQIAKPHRLASVVLAIMVIGGIFLAPHPVQAIHWSIAWGSAFSTFVIYQSLTVIRRSFNRHYQRVQN